MKANTAAKFLKEGDKVKVSLRFRGREKDYAARGREVMDKFAEMTADISVVEKKPVFEGRSLTMFLAPKPKTSKLKKKFNIGGKNHHGKK